MGRYAESTTVPVFRTQAEIQATLSRYGADAYRMSYRDELAIVEFQAHNRMIRFRLPLPSKHDTQFTMTPNRKDLRSKDQATKAWEQACRQLWRALAIAIKAKLEAVECGITEFEDEFLAYVVDPQTGRTVGELMRPQIEQRYEHGSTDLLALPAPSAPDS